MTHLQLSNAFWARLPAEPLTHANAKSAALPSTVSEQAQSLPSCSIMHKVSTSINVSSHQVYLATGRGSRLIRDSFERPLRNNHGDVKKGQAAEEEGIADGQERSW